MCLFCFCAHPPPLYTYTHTHTHTNMQTDINTQAYIRIVPHALLGDDLVERRTCWFPSTAQRTICTVGRVNWTFFLSFCLTACVASSFFFVFLFFLFPSFFLSFFHHLPPLYFSPLLICLWFLLSFFLSCSFVSMVTIPYIPAFPVFCRVPTGEVVFHCRFVSPSDKSCLLQGSLWNTLTHKAPCTVYSV